MNIRLIIVTGLAVCIALWTMPGTVRGQIYVTNTSGTIGEYNATSGATINSSLVSGLSGPTGITVSGGNLFVANSSAGTIGEYNATTGATVNASLVSGLNNPAMIALFGGNLLVVNYGAGTIGEYNATTGATINASLVSGLNNPLGIAVFGGNLLVANFLGNTIGEYNATTGATVNASLVSGLNSPYGIAAVPEPSTWAAGLLTASALLRSIKRRRAGWLTLPSSPQSKRLLNKRDEQSAQSLECNAS